MSCIYSLMVQHLHLIKDEQCRKSSRKCWRKITLDALLQQTSTPDLIVSWNEILCFYDQSQETLQVYLYTVYTKVKVKKLSCCLSYIAYFRIEMFYCAMMMPVREYCGMGYIVEDMLSGGLREATLLLIVSLCQRIHCCKQTRAVRKKPTHVPSLLKTI